MSDDVHDIDDLFKKNLEEYSEDAPPDAWEAVSHALDKQQAILYKSKYKQLKRAALFLSILCLLGGMYIAYDVWQHKLVTSEHKQQTATSSTKETNQNPADKNDSNVSVGVIENNNQPKKNEQKQKTITDEDSASVNNDVLVQKQKAEATRIVNKNPFEIDSSSTFINADNNKMFVSTDKNLAKQKTEQTEEDNYNWSEHRALQDFDLQPLSLQKEDNTITLLSLQKALENRKPALLSTNTSSTIKIKSRAAHSFSLSFFAAPNFSFERIEDNDHHRDGQGGMGQERHRDEENNFSLSGGVLFNYQLNKNISLQSGVSVTAFSTFIAPKTVYAKTDNNGHIRYELNCSLGSAFLPPKNNTQVAVGDSSETSAGTSHLVYVNVPLIASYQINKGRFLLLPAIGAGLNVLVDGKIKTGLNDGVDGNAKTTTSINGLKRTYLNGSLGFGVEYNLSPKISLGLRPNAKLSLTSINKEMPVKSYQNYLGMEAGVRIKM